MTAGAEHRAATMEMIAAINQCAAETRVLQGRAEHHRAIVERQEEEEKRDDEITKMVLAFSLGGVLVSVVITFMLAATGIHPLQSVVI